MIQKIFIPRLTTEPHRIRTYRSRQELLDITTEKKEPTRPQEIHPEQERATGKKKTRPRKIERERTRIKEKRRCESENRFQVYKLLLINALTSLRCAVAWQPNEIEEK